MHRRRVLAVGCALCFGLSGCVGRRGSTDVSPGSPRQVQTTTADGIEFLVAQVAITSGAEGPDAYYRLRNTGPTDATIRIDTVLSIQPGGTYEAGTVVTVPAGDEVTVRYRIVAFDALSETEQARVRRGEGVDFDVFVNGQLRDDV